MSETRRKQLGWPAAATLIAAIIGALATSLALGIAPINQESADTDIHLQTARELGEVNARLTALESSTEQMRKELRSDMQQLRELVQQLLKQE